MTERFVHMVGTYPAETTQKAMSIMAAAAGDRLRTLPDGEVGDRNNWLICIIDGLRTHPDFELVRDADWRDYKHVPKLRIKSGHRVDPTSIHLGYEVHARKSYAEFNRLREANPQLSDTAFQVGIASDFDLAFFTFGPLGGFTKRDLFRQALVGEVQRIASMAGDDVVFQIELPVELVLVATMPGPLASLLAGVLAKGTAKTVAATPNGTRFGIHLCVGDLGNKPLKQPSTAKPLVTLTNALLRHWPATHKLDFVHLPLAFGDVPPVTEGGFYAPLEGLDLPAGMRLIAGLAHEEQDLEHQQEVLRMVEQRTGGTVDVGSACGLGRRTPDGAQAALRRAVALADA